MVDRLIGLIGYPVGHSKSPVMHNDSFRAQELPFQYHAFDVHPEQLQQAVEGMKALGFKGFNVTIPHKVAVMEYLDAIDDGAMKIGAVNTVVNDNGKWIGYNTDGRGYVLSLEHHLDRPMKEKRFLVIGSGGAARGIVYALSQKHPARLDVANRTPDKAAAMLDSLKLGADSRAITIEMAQETLSEYDVLINTTPVGMSPNTNQIPISLENMKKGTFVSDIIYNPLETEWLKQGKTKGANIHHGIGMFVGQGALAYEKWTGTLPDLDRMTNVVLHELGGNNHADR